MEVKYILKITECELKALSALMHENPCRVGCCYEENQYNDAVDCGNCEFTKGKWSLINKIDELS